MTSEQGTYRRRTLRALSWSALSSAGSVALMLGRSALLSRLLSPADFGLFGLVAFALSATSTLTDMGLGRFALVAHFDGPAEQRRFLDTAWVAQVARGAALTFLMVAVAGPYARAVNQRSLAPLLVASSATLFIGALASPASWLLYRHLEQRTLAVVRLSTDMFGLAVTALLAWRAPSAWALVAGSLAGASLGAALSYAAHPYRPRFAFDRALYSRGFAQGRHVGVVVALTFVTTQVDNLIVGRMLGSAALGVYLFAYRLATLPIEQVQAVASSVAVPAYARHRSEGPVVLALQLRRVLAVATTILCAGLLPALILRREVVWALGGPRWEAATPLLLPLCLLALLRCTSIHLGTLLQSVERAELDARGKIIEAAVFAPGCALAVHVWGLLGAGWAGALTYALAVVLRTRALTVVLPGEVAAVTAVWSRLALAAVACGSAGLLAERAGASPLWLAPASLAAFIVLALRLEPELPIQLRQLLARTTPAAS